MRGFSRVSKGRLDQAFSDFNQALSLDPKEILAYVGRGAVHAQRKDYDQAITDLDKALEFSQNLPGRALASIYAARGKIRLSKVNVQYVSQAITGLNQISKPEIPNFKNSSPDQSIVNILLRFEVPLGNRDLEQALADFDKALNLTPDDGEILKERGSVYLDLQSYDKALSDFEQALKSNPHDAETYFFQGLSYFKKQDYNDALSAFDQVFKLNPKLQPDPNYVWMGYIGQGIVYQSKGDKQNAVKVFQKVLELPAEPGVKKLAKYKLQELE